MKVWLRLLSATAHLVCFPLMAGEAIPSYQIWTHALVGYAWGGGGFAFSPQNEITVTALGYDDDDLSLGPETVSLLDSNSLQLATVLVTSNSPLFHWTRYETIPSIRLSAGETFYVRACPSNDFWTGRVVLADSPNQNGTFSVGPDLIYLATAGGTNADGTFPAGLEPSWVLRIGPNFTYVVGTSVLLNGLQVTPETAQIGFSIVGKPTASFTLLESTQPGGPWSTNLAAVLTTNLPGASYTFSAPHGGPAKFYRVQIP